MKKTLVIIFLIIISAAQSAEMLNLEQSINIALLNNEEILKARRELQKSGYRYDEAFSATLPRIEAKATVLRKGYSSEIDNMVYDMTGLGNQVAGMNNHLVETDPGYEGKEIPMTEMPDRSVDAVKDNTIKWEVNAYLSLYNGAIGAAIDIAKVYENLSKVSYELVREQVITDVKKSFYNVLSLRKALEVIKLVKEDADKNLANINVMYEQGLVSEYDLIKAKVRVSSIRPKILNFSNNLELARAAFKSKLGRDLDSDITIVGAMEDGIKVDTDNYKFRAVNNRNELKLLSFQKEMLRKNQDIEFSGHLPTVAAIANYTFQSQNDDYGDTFEKNFGVHSVNVGVTATFPIFFGGQVNAKVDQAKMEVKKADLDIRRNKKLIELQADQNFKKIEESREEIKLQDEAVAEAEKALEIANVRYQSNVGTQLEVIDAQTSLEEARLARIMSIHGLTQAVIDFEYSVGESGRNIN